MPFAETVLRTARPGRAATTSASFIRRPLAVAIALAVAALAQPAAAVTCNLLTNGDWGVGTNWDCGVRPVAADTANIGLGGSVDVTQAESVLNLGNAGTVNINAFLLTLNAAGSSTNSGTINVGSASTAALNLNNNHALDNTGGTINVTNTGSTVNLFSATISNGDIVTAGDVVLNSSSTLTGTTLTTTGSGVVRTNGSNVGFLDGVTITNGSTFAAGNFSTTGLFGTITNDGTLLGGSTGSTTVFRGDNDVTLTGSGVVELQNANDVLRNNSNALTLTNDSNHTIQGFGQLGANLGNYDNLGVVQANVNGQTLTVDPADAGVFSNTGTLRATNGGTLALNRGNYDNTGGLIEAQNDSTVQLNNLAAIANGDLTTSGTGVIQAAGSSTVTLSDVTITNGSTYRGQNFSTTRLNGTITNEGEMLGGSTGATTSFTADSDTTLAGSGTLRLQHINDRLLSGNAAFTVTNSASHTVEGFGQFGANVGGIDNAGLIDANVSGQSLVVDPSAALGATNTGTMRASNGGDLVFGAGNYDNTGGLIQAQDASTVSMANLASITNGTLDTDGSGTLNVNGSAVVTLTDVVLSAGSTLNTGNFSTTRFNNTLTNDGTVAVQSAGATTNLVTATDLALNGSGEIVLGANVDRLYNEANTLTMTQAASHTIRGQGQVGINIGRYVNNGLIEADVNGGALIVDPGTVASVDDFTNLGTLRASNGSTLQLNGGEYENSGGLITAVDGSEVLLASGADIRNGTLTSDATSQFRLAGSSVGFLSNLELTTGSTYKGGNFSTTRLDGTITNNGEIIGGSTGATTDIVSNTTDVTLAGNGTLTLQNQADRLYNQSNGLTITNTANHTIQGQGQLGVNVGRYDNQGLIDANVNGALLTVDPGTIGTDPGLFNSGTMRASNGGVMRLNAGIYDNTGGLIEAQSGSEVQLGSSASITGGDLTSNGTGRFLGLDSSLYFLSDLRLTSGSTYKAGNFSTTDLGGTIVNDGQMTGGSTGATTDFRISADATLSGTGTLTMQNNADRFNLSANANTLTNDANHTIDGFGQFGLNVGGIDNVGTIDANVAATTLTVNTGAGRTTTNTGTLRASNGGNLNMLDGFTGPTGSVQTTSGGTVTVGAASDTGTLSNDANLALGANDLTVFQDYTNANSGSGNGFDRRANVTGTGQILAGGDVAQAITGANVTDGTTANATLTIGNVRVGATTFDYQIANTGTTGPSLRGAIQDAANGGNITDARLSGAGVTAGNYNTGGPGSDTGNLGVTFSVGTAGALAPLTGQAVNLTSNFDNVGDQLLNIELASGAAAYNAAVGSAAPDPIVVANQRVGVMGAGQALTVSNTAAGGTFTEGLNANFGANSGDATNNGGNVVLLAGGASNSANMAVNVSNATAGAKSGSVTLNYETDGAGTSGLAAQSVGSQTINVSGDVFNVAQPTLATTNITIANQRIGGGLTQGLGVTNTDISPLGFQEALDATIAVVGSGVTATGPAINNLAQGATDSTSFQLGVDSGSAGAKSGSVTIAFASDGTGTSGFGPLSLANQAVNVSGNVYKEAEGQLNTAALNFGTVQVGQGVSQVLSIDNIATGASGFVEDLNVRFGASSGTGATQISGSGQINNLVAGGNDASSMVVSVDTSAAGTISGAIAIDYFTAGTVGGISNGLNELFLNSDSYGVSGTIQTGGMIVDAADPLINNPMIALGNVRINSASPTANVSVTNVASGNQQAALDASIAGNGPITASGSFNDLLPGATNSGSLSVGLDTSTAGAVNGTATVDFVSDASNIGGCQPNCEMSLLSQDVGVSGAVYRLANGQAAGPVDLGAIRVGDADASATIAVTNQSPDAFTEALNVSIAGGTPGAPFSASGSITGLGAQASDGSSLVVLMDSGTAGNFSDSVGLNYVSTGAGTTGAADIGAGSETVAVSGKVYAAAVKQLDTTSLDFGIVHVGDVVAAQSIGVTNAAAAAGLNDTMQASIGSLSSGFTGGGAVSGLGAGASGALMVGLNTATAGIFNGAAGIDFASQNPDMADLDLGSMQVMLTGQVNNHANPEFAKSGGSGALTGGGLLFELDFGNVQLGQSRAATLALFNAVTGPADLLSGSYQQTAGVDGNFDFAIAGFDPFSGLMAGDSQMGLDVMFNAASLGAFTDVIELMAIGSNASGFSENFAVRLVLSATVVQGGGTGSVPLPPTLLLIVPFVLLVGRRVAARR